MTVVAVTGVSGNLGSAILAGLDCDADIKKIVGIDLKEPPVKSSKLKFFKKDIRDSSIQTIFNNENVDTLLHLAFVVTPIKDKALHRDIDINGSKNILYCTESTGIKKLIYSSSTSVYGFYPYSSLPFDEGVPVNPNRENLYAVHNAEVEEIFKQFFKDKKDFDLTIFRPCMILGAAMDNFSCEFARKLPFIITIAGHNPEVQFVHEEDVLEAFIYSIKNSLNGIYNLTGKGTITMKDFCRIFKKPSLPLNFQILRTIHKILWTLRTPSVTFGPEWLSFFRYSCIATSDKFTRVCPEFPKYSTKYALETYIEIRSCN